MSDSAVAITAGSGTNIDTRTEATNGNHRQVIVIGDPSTNAGVAPVDATNGLAVDVKGSALTSLQLLDDVVATDGSAALTKGYQVCGTDGTNAQIISTTTAGVVNVADAGGSITVDNAGTFAVQVDGAALTSLQLLDDVVATDGSAALTKGYQVCGTDGTNAQIISTTTTGAVNVAIVSGAGSGGTAMTDDAAFTVGTTSITPVGGTYKSTRDAVDDNDGGAFAMNAKRGLYVSLETPLSDSAMDDTNDCVKASVVVALPAGTNNIGDVDVLTLPNVTLAAGTNTNEVVGDVAHDAAIAGNPLTIGGVASAAAPSDVSADQDAVRAWFLRNGAQATVVTAAGALIGGDATNGLDVDVTRLPALPAGTNNIGDVDVLTLPALPAGNNNIGDVDAIQSGTWTVQPGNTANTTAWLVSTRPSASGGTTPYKLNSAASTNATTVKASAGQVYMITASNTNAAVRYLKLYNKASNPTVGSDTPVLVFAIPGNTAGAGTNIPVPDSGIAFSTGIAFALVTGAADSDNTGVAANEIIVNMAYT